MAVPTLDELIDEAKAQGFLVSEKGNRVLFTSPLGETVRLPNADPDDRHARFNNRTMLRHIWFKDLKPDTKRSRTEPTESESETVPFVSELVEEYLREHPNRNLTNKQVAAALNLNPRQVGNSLVYLGKTRPELTNVSLGVWYFKDSTAPVPAAVPQPAPRAKTRVKKAVPVAPTPPKRPSRPPRPAGTKGDKKVAAERVTIDTLEPPVITTEPVNGTPQPALGPATPSERPAERPVDLTKLTPAPVLELAQAPAIKVAPAELPTEMPSLFQSIGVHRSGAVILLDENNDVWLAHPLQITGPTVTAAMSATTP